MIEKVKFGGKAVPNGNEIQKNNVDWVNYGSDNLYPQFLIDLFYNSSFQSGIIKGKTNYITSSGFEIIGTPEQKAAANVFFQNGNHEKDFSEVLNNAALDLELFNGFAIKVVKRLDGSFAYIDNVPFETVRRNAEKSRIFVSENWATSNQSEETGFDELQVFDPNEDEQLVGVLYYATPSKNYETSRNGKVTNVYPREKYSGGIKDILTDMEISAFHYYEMQNGMKTGTMVTFTNGEPPESEKRKLVDSYKNGMTNTENSGSIFLNFVKGQEQLPQIDTLSGNDLDKRYLALSEDVRAKILISHSITTPVLFGIKDGSGQLGASNELQIGFEIFKKTYIRDSQNTLEKVFNYLQKALGYATTIKMNEVEQPFTIESTQSITEEINVPVNENEFSDTLLEAFSKTGRDKGGFEIIASQEIQQGTPENEQSFMQSFHAEKFALLSVEIMLLSMLENGESLSAVAEALEINESRVVRIYASLKDRGYIDASGNVTSTGKLEIKGVGTRIPEVVYSYELRSDAPALVPGGKSRQFCQALINVNRFYTRDEIDALTPLTPTGLSAWAYRGGWYTNPKGSPRAGVHQLGCRHTWKQNIIIPNE